MYKLIPVASALSLLATGYYLAGLQPAIFVPGTCPECGSEINKHTKTPEK